MFLSFRERNFAVVNDDVVRRALSLCNQLFGFHVGRILFSFKVLLGCNNDLKDQYE
jgi:hypothetical protein